MRRDRLMACHARDVPSEDMQRQKIENARLFSVACVVKGLKQ